MIPQATLHVGYINMDRLTWSKFELFNSNFTSGLDQSHYDFLALAEVGEKMRQELDKQGWLVSEPATHSSEGLAVFVKTSIRRHIIKVNSLSPRDIAITLLTQHGTVTFFFVYAPGENYPQQTYAKFLENIKKQMREHDKHEVVIIGDMNAN